MKTWTRKQLTELMRDAQALGHTPAFTHKPPPPEFPDGVQKFYAECSCGYKSTMRATQSEAIRTGIYHLMKEVLASDLDQAGERLKNGVSVPESAQRLT